MRRTFRLKLLAIVGVAGAALVVILVSSAIVEQRVNDHIATIRERFIPKIGLREKLRTGFDQIGRQLKDAVDASDADALEDARRAERGLLDVIAGTRDAIEPADAVALRRAIDDYYAAAEAVTRRMIRG